MYGYKVVHEDVDGLWSTYTKSAICEYCIGKKTVRPNNCGPLAAFADLADAIREFNFTSYNPFKIYRCRIKRSKDNRLWNHNSPRIKGFDGTIYCDSIQLIKEMKNHG